MRVFRKRALADLLGLSTRSIDRKTNPTSPYFDRDFPQPIKIGANTVGFLAEEIEAWIARRTAMRVAPGPA